MNDDASSLEPLSPGRLTTASTPHIANGNGANSLAVPTAAPSWTERLFGWLRAPTNGTDLRTDLEDALQEEQALDHDFSPEERAMLRNILRLRETRTEDVMIPRADIVAIDHSATLGEVLAELRSSGHSRMPVFDGSLDQPLGLVHIKDVVSFLIDRARKPVTSARQKARASKAGAEDLAGDELAGDERAAIKAGVTTYDPRKIDLDSVLKDVGIIRDLLFVPASMPATDLMAQMQAQRTQMALVIDEYGGTDGLISLEDLIETVVGDIEDEHDDETAPHFDAIGDGGYTADARVPIEDVQMVFGDLFQVDEDDAEELDTLGGLVFTALGRIPVRGELIDAVEGLDIEVTDADPRRIKRLKVYPAGLRRRDPRAPRRTAVRGGGTSEPANDAGSDHDQVQSA